MINSFPKRSEKHLINAQPPHNEAAVQHYARKIPSQRGYSEEHGKKENIIKKRKY